jgi:hypothetical protein
MTTIGGLGGPLMSMGSGVATVIEDYFWLGQFNGGIAGELEPIPAVVDFNDIWDLDGTDYMLDQGTATADEGYWILDANGDVEPLDV